MCAVTLAAFVCVRGILKVSRASFGGGCGVGAQRVGEQPAVAERA